MSKEKQSFVLIQRDDRTPEEAVELIKKLP
jgi:hypothetical protein